MGCAIWRGPHAIVAITLPWGEQNSGLSYLSGLADGGAEPAPVTT
jgi:hypothetical protein